MSYLGAALAIDALNKVPCDMIIPASFPAFKGGASRGRTGE